MLLSFRDFGQQNNVVQPPAAASRIVSEQCAVHVGMYLSKGSTCFTEVTEFFEQSTYILEKFVKYIPHGGLTFN